MFNSSLVLRSYSSLKHSRSSSSSPTTQNVETFLINTVLALGLVCGQNHVNEHWQQRESRLDACRSKRGRRAWSEAGKMLVIEREGGGAAIALHHVDEARVRPDDSDGKVDSIFIRCSGEMPECDVTILRLVSPSPFAREGRVRGSRGLRRTVDDVC
jgi:hypothetical protein